MKNSDKIILDLCGGTGSWSSPYKEAGYRVDIITLPEFDITDVKIYTDHIEFPRTADFLISPRIIYPKNIYGIFAAPPCTMFSLARTKAKKPRDFTEGMEVVRACMNIIWMVREHKKLAFWAVENPMGYLRQFMGKPLFQFDPSEFGGDYNKTTDVWGYFNAPKKQKAYQRFNSTDKNTRSLPPIPDGYVVDKNMTHLQIKRSITPPCFAKAFFKANQ